MKRLSPLLIFLLLASCSKEVPVVPLEKLNFRNNIAYEINSTDPFSGVAIEYFEEEQSSVRSKTSYKDGKIEGPYEEYYKSGQLKEMSYVAKAVYFIDVDLDTQLVTYSSDSFFVGFYREGVYRTYFENGQIEYLKFIVDPETGLEYGDTYDRSGHLVKRTYLKIKDDTMPELEFVWELFDMEGNITSRNFMYESAVTYCDYSEGKITKRIIDPEQIFEIEGSPLDAEICNIDKSRFTYSVTVE